MTLNAELLVLVLRLALLAILYLFLWQLVAVVWADLRQASPTAGPAAQASWKLQLLDPGESSLPVGRSFNLKPRTVVGRGPDNDIILDDGFVSTRHAVLTLKNGEWRVKDLGARNGTFINDSRISGEVSLSPGDLLAFGPVRLKLLS